MKTQRTTCKRFRLHSLWRVFLLCSVFIHSFWSAQVCIGNVLKLVSNSTVATGFFLTENNRQIEFIFSRQNNRTFVVDEETKIYWPHSDSLIFQFNRIEEKYFPCDSIPIVFPAIPQNSDTKSKAFPMFLSYCGIESIDSKVAVLNEIVPFKIISIQHSLCLLRAPPSV